jgi:general stress protein YciG
MATSTRGFAKMSRSRVREIARKGGKNSPTKFQIGDPRASMAGQKGGQARAKAHKVNS